MSARHASRIARSVRCAISAVIPTKLPADRSAGQTCRLGRPVDAIGRRPTGRAHGQMGHPQRIRCRVKKDIQNTFGRTVLPQLARPFPPQQGRAAPMGLDRSAIQPDHRGRRRMQHPRVRHGSRIRGAAAGTNQRYHQQGKLPPSQHGRRHEGWTDPTNRGRSKFRTTIRTPSSVRSARREPELPLPAARPVRPAPAACH